MIDPEQPIPEMRGSTGDGGSLQLHQYRGRWVVVYFYPRDNTPGCTTEAGDFRDLYPRFVERDAEVIGVSRDSVTSHGGFAAKHALPFPLVSDADETWCKAFDVIHEKTLYGKTSLGIVRSTFLVNPEGKLAYAWRKVRVKDHAQQVLDELCQQQHEEHNRA